MKTLQYFRAFTLPSDWYFLPMLFSGTTGIIIGLKIASILGWV